MGLDVCAYTGVIPATGDHDDDDTMVRVHVNAAFPGRCDEFVDGQIYAAPGHVRFGAGAYSTYNRWRDDLATMAGWDGAESAWKAKAGPFWELINFSDCEGCLGTAVSAKLAGDFARFLPQARAFGGPFLAKYLQFSNAFQLASVGGLVRFC